MSNQRQISLEEARSLGTQLVADGAKITAEQFRRGLEVEMKHGAHNLRPNVTTDDPS